MDKEFSKEKKEHPELNDTTIKKIVHDHEKKKKQTNEEILESIIESFIYVSFRLFESIPNNFRIRRRI